MIKGHGPGPPAFPLEMLSANHDGHKAQSQQQLLWSKPIFSLRQPCFSPKWVRVSTLQYLNILHSWRFCSLFYLSSKSSGNLLNLVLVLGVKFSKCFIPRKVWFWVPCLMSQAFYFIKGVWRLLMKMKDRHWRESKEASAMEAFLELESNM